MKKLLNKINTFMNTKVEPEQVVLVILSLNTFIIFLIGNGFINKYVGFAVVAFQILPLREQVKFAKREGRTEGIRNMMNIFGKEYDIKIHIDSNGNEKYDIIKRER